MKKNNNFDLSLNRVENFIKVFISQLFDEAYQY